MTSGASIPARRTAGRMRSILWGILGLGLTPAGIIIAGGCLATLTAGEAEPSGRSGGPWQIGGLQRRRHAVRGQRRRPPGGVGRIARRQGHPAGRRAGRADRLGAQPRRREADRHLRRAKARSPCSTRLRASCSRRSRPGIRPWVRRSARTASGSTSATASTTTSR